MTAADIQLDHAYCLRGGLIVIVTAISTEPNLRQNVRYRLADPEKDRLVGPVWIPMAMFLEDVEPTEPVIPPCVKDL